LRPVSRPAKLNRVQTSVEIMLMDSASSELTVLERDLLPRLHPLEQSRYRSFTHDRRRRSWLAGRALILAALSQHTGSVEAAELRTDDSGGVLYKDGALKISLSHSQDLMGAALSTARIGLDLEWPRPRPALSAVARQFSPAETAGLDALPSTSRHERIYALWTLKEAACKAAGLSIWEGLRNARFDLSAGSFELSPPFTVGDWSFLHAGLAGGARLALAVREAAAPVAACWRLTAPGQWGREALVQPAFMYAR
jgi:4'-phosphopantetheinyl transferase